MRHIGFCGVASIALMLGLAAPAVAQIKIALDTPPDLEGSGSYVWAHTFSEHLKEAGLDVEIYQRGALGGDEELFDQVSQGILEVSMSPLNITGSLDTLIFGLRLPYFFEGIEEVDHALNEGGMLERINDNLAGTGVRVLAVNTVGQGMGIFNTKRPVETVSDMAGLRMRALDESQIELFQAWGAAGTIVNLAELPNALQTGIADGYLNPPIVPLLFGHTDFIKFFTDAEIAPSLRVALASEDWYMDLSDEDREKVESAAEAANLANREWLSRQDGVYDRLREAGIQIAPLSEEARAEFYEVSSITFEGGLLSTEEIELWREALGR